MGKVQFRTIYTGHIHYAFIIFHIIKNDIIVDMLSEKKMSDNSITSHGNAQDARQKFFLLASWRKDANGMHTVVDRCVTVYISRSSNVDLYKVLIYNSKYLKFH